MVLADHPDDAAQAVQASALNWPDYQRLVPRSILLLPIGAVETHGAHLPLNTDTIIVEYLAQRIAPHVGALVLPTIHYGVMASPIRLGGEFPGNLDLAAPTFIDHVFDLLTAAYRDGGRSFLILYATYSNGPIIHEAAKRFIATADGARVMAVSWWNLVTEETRNAIAEETGVARSEDHHSGMVETSLIMYMSPESVRTELVDDEGSARRVTYLVLPMPDDLATPTGIVYRARAASAEIGKRVTDEVLENLLAAVRLEFQLPDG